MSNRVARIVLMAAALACVVALAQDFLRAQGGGGGGRGGGAPAAPGQGAARGGGAATGPRDTTTPTGTGSISGSVVLSGTGAPVRRARVSLTGAELRGGRTTITDDSGGFAFLALPAGRFTLSVSKAGFLDMTYGAKSPGRQGTPIQLADGQKIEKATITIPRGSVITGIVVDDHGEPSPGTPVRALRYVIRTGEKTLQLAGQDQTDDRGMYRIYQLQPGDYIVSAVPRNMNASDLRQSITTEINSVLQQIGQSGGGAGGRGPGGGPGGGGPGGGGPGGRGGAVAGIDINALGLNGGASQQLLDRVSQLQAQLGQADQEQSVAYAPVYFPGTTSASQATTVTLLVGQERAAVDFQLQLVATAKVVGTVQNQDGSALPQGTQVALVSADRGGVPSIPGLGSDMARVGQDGHFQFLNVTPGQYSVQARATIRQQADPNAATATTQAQGPGGRGFGGGRGGPNGPPGRPGGPGAITQVLWAAADLTVNGQDVPNVGLTLQPGMTVSGTIQFQGSSLQPPSDLTRVRVSLSARGTQPLEIAQVPPAEVDSTGHFTITGVVPGHYMISGSAPAGTPGGNAPGGGAGGTGNQGALGGLTNIVASVQATAAGRQGGGRAGGAGGGGGGGGGAAGGARGGFGGAAGGGARGGGGVGAQGGGSQWTLKSAVVNGADVLDFALEIGPNQSVTNALLTFTDKTQDLSGTIQDASGRPTSDFTIIVYPADNRYWLPQARRIASARPATDGKFDVRGLPAGDYRLTAVTDVEPGEWYDPSFLSQLVSQSVPISLGEGEKKTQDLKLATAAN